MSEEVRRLESPVATVALRQILMRLGREASIEMNVHDLADLEPSREYLPVGAKIYVSHLPKQSFEDTLRACAIVEKAGFEAVPHIPVRLLASNRELKKLVRDAADSDVKELLLIAGDYPRAAGPYSSVSDVLRAVDLRDLGIERISVGGHPEGHTKVPLEEIRTAELGKAQLARDNGLAATIITQFFFESAPFLAWAASLRAAGVIAGIRAGLAGPAKITTLLRFAVRCGVGPSMKALGSRPGAFTKLLGDRGPEHLLTDLAAASIETANLLQGIHMFCFGGYLRTCHWLQALALGNFQFDESGELVMR